MMQARKIKKPVSAEPIARMADRGEDVSGFFTKALDQHHLAQKARKARLV